MTGADPVGPLTTAQVLRMAFPGDGGGSGRGADTAIHVIPQSRVPASEPRWIICGDARIAAPVLASWRPFKWGTRLRWSAVTAAASVGALSRLPGVVNCGAYLDLSFWRRLPGFSDDWVPVIHVGNPSHTRKIIVFFVGRDRRFRAVAKVPLAAGAADAILHEADVLAALHGSPYLPQLLFRDPERGIAAQSWLEGKPVGRKLIPAHMDLLAAWHLPGQTIRLSELRPGIEAALGEADLPYDRGVLSRALRWLECDRPLPAFIEHRDFAPWNLKHLAGGKTGAMDWEWAELRGLPCQDLFRYFYIQDALFYGPGTVWPMLNSHPMAQAYYRRFEIPSEALPSLVLYYLLRVLVMDWRSRNRLLTDHSFRQVEELLRAV